MRLIVPDASVLLKWVLPPAQETYVPQALALRAAHENGGINLLLPTLWLYETGNTLARKFPDDGNAMQHQIVRMRINTLEPALDVLRKTFDLSERYGVTFYDASYHALALIHTGTFVTADERYIAKAKKAGGVLFLADFGA